MGHACDGFCIHGTDGSVAAYFCGSAHADVHERRGGDRVRKTGNALFLPVLFPAQYYARTGGNGSRNRKKCAADGDPSDIPLPVSDHLDPVCASAVFHDRWCFCAVSGFVGVWHGAHDIVYMEGKMAGGEKVDMENACMYVLFMMWSDRYPRRSCKYLSAH